MKNMQYKNEEFKIKEGDKKYNYKVIVFSLSQSY